MIGTLVRVDPAQFVAAGVVAEPGEGSDMAGSDAELDALKALIRNCQAQVERLRSWSAASRSSMELSAVGRP